MIQEKKPPQTQSQDEEHMILRSQTDPEAFRPLYEKYFKRIFLFVLHRVEDKSLAADITSQVFLKALIHIKRFKFRGIAILIVAVQNCAE